jgi:uncharacterized protein (TIGR03083 family)
MAQPAELAVLLALDALEDAEQADAELRHGSFPAELIATSGALAEGAATAAPAGLRRAVLGAALARRPAGTAVGAEPPADPVQGFAASVADLYRLLHGLDVAEWELPAHPEHGRVRELIAHLVGVEELALRWLDPTDDVPPMPDHIAATRGAVTELAGASPEEILRRWHTAALTVAEVAGNTDQRRRIAYHDLTSTVAGFMIARTFELWAHAGDVCAATGRPLPTLDPPRLAAMSGRLMAVLPLGLAYRGRTAPGHTARLVLTGEGGGTYLVPLAAGQPAGEPAVTIVADTYQLCRVAARRLSPQLLPVTVDGDRGLGDLVLAGLDAFARD